MRYGPEIDERMEKIEALSKLEPNWNGYGEVPPTPDVCTLAYFCLGLASAMKMLPTGIVPSGENGIGFTFRRADRYADIEFLNSGEVLMGLDDRNKNLHPAKYPKVLEVEKNVDSLKAALQRIERFLEVGDEDLHAALEKLS